MEIIEEHISNYELKNLQGTVSVVYSDPLFNTRITTDQLQIIYQLFCFFKLFLLIFSL